MARVGRRRFLERVGQWTLGAAATASLHGGEATKPESAAGRIRIGQIGTKHAHASGKVSALRKLDRDFEVVGVVEPDAERRKAVEDSGPYRSLRWMSEEDLLATKGLAAVAVETEVAELVPTGRRCVEAGLHVHLDKPPGGTVEGFEELLRKATARGVVVQMGYMLRYNPAFQLLYQAVRDDWLGDVFEIHAVMSKSVDDSSRKELAEFRGGGMFELGCHLIDSVVTLVGAPQKVTAFTRRTRADLDSLADNQLAVLEYPTAIATVRIALVEYLGTMRRQFVVCGDQGTIDIRPLESGRMQVAFSEARGRFQKGYQTVELSPAGGRYDGEFADLARIIRGEKAPDWGPDHDLAVHRAVLQAAGMMPG